MLAFVRSLQRLAVVLTLLLSFFVLIEYQTPSITHAASVEQLFTCGGWDSSFTVPTDVYSLYVDMAGGSGGEVGWSWGRGGRVEVTIQVTPGEYLDMVTGCHGWANDGTPGYPNGGLGTVSYGGSMASGGGGSSSIHLSGNVTPLVVAGGGGGATNWSGVFAGAGGQNGGDASGCDTRYPQLLGKGATQSAPGAPSRNLEGIEAPGGGGGFMQGGEGNLGGGGGGGYYGGSGIENTNVVCPGGGGSSYVDPARSASFSAPVYDAGYKDGDGYIRLSWTPSPTTTTSTTTTTTTTLAPSTTSTTTPLVTSATIPTTSSVASTTTTTPVAPTTSTSTTAPAATSPVAKPAPSWTATPEMESELPVVGVTPFPISGLALWKLRMRLGLLSRRHAPLFHDGALVSTLDISSSP